MDVLLLGADYYGTLAAARCFARHGLDVAMADASQGARGLYSRWVRERLVHPPASDPDALVRWLVAYGEAHRGALLYPTNDHLAWIYADHRRELEAVFTMYGPSEETLVTLLDKARLQAACVDVGLAVPETRSLDHGEPDLAFPLLLKPRTQALLLGGVKGLLVESPQDLDDAVARFRELVRFAPALLARHPELADPIAQAYHVAAETRIVSVAGFVDRSGAIATRTAVKVLQRPRKIGIGLCFEGRDAEPDLTERIGALCARVGYFGAFEAELIADGDRRLLIDFNPRFYSQMAFEIARGLPIPLLVWHAAKGDDARVRALLAQANAWRPDGDERYCHKAMLDLVLALQGISGRMPRADVQRWRAWYGEHRDAVTDAVHDPEDRLPSVVDAAQWVGHFARHPRSFVRGYVLNR